MRSGKMRKVRASLALVEASAGFDVVVWTTFGRGTGAPCSMADNHSPGFALIEQYYRNFNERRFSDAAALFTEDADIDTGIGSPEKGPASYVRFAEAWVAAFPDAVFTIERVERRSASMCEVDLLATGTHQGLLSIAGCHFRPSGGEAVLRVRELLDIRHERIVASLLSINIKDLIEQLSTVDYDELSQRLQRLAPLAQDLADADGNLDRRREVALRIGAELDAARRAVRPYYYR